MDNTIIIEATKGSKKCLLKYNKEKGYHIVTENDTPPNFDRSKLVEESEKLSINKGMLGWVYKLGISKEIDISILTLHEGSKSAIEENNQYENLEDLLDSIDIDPITKGFLENAVKCSCISLDM